MEPNLTIDEHIDLLEPEEVEELFTSLTSTIPTATIESFIEETLTDAIVFEYLSYMDENALREEVSNLISMLPTVESVKELAIDNPAQATLVLDELLYWCSQGRI